MDRVAPELAVTELYCRAPFRPEGPQGHSHAQCREPRDFRDPLRSEPLP